MTKKNATRKTNSLRAIGWGYLLLNARGLHHALCVTHNDPRQGGGDGAHLGKRRVVPGCPGVCPGCSRGGGHLGPVGRVALPRVCRSPRGVARRCSSPGAPRSGQKNESFVRFMIFGLFLSLIFACCISDFACFGSFFSTIILRCPRLGLPLGSRCPRSTSGGRACRHARGDRHLGHDASWRSRTPHITKTTPADSMP